MPDGRDGPPEEGGGAERDPEARVLLVLIAKSHAVFDDVMTILLDVGIAGTVIESKGLMALIREELPVFSGLASLVPETTGSRVVVSVTTEGQARSLFESLEGELSESERPIAVTTPVSGVMGLG